MARRKGAATAPGVSDASLRRRLRYLGLAGIAIDPTESAAAAAALRIAEELRAEGGRLAADPDLSPAARIAEFETYLAQAGRLEGASRFADHMERIRAKWNGAD